MKSTTLLLAAIVVAAIFVAPAAANAKYFHTDLPPCTVTNPVTTPAVKLHELYPEYCNWYDLTSWYDNGNGELSYCDVIDITDAAGGVTYWHVEEVTVTIKLLPHPVNAGDTPMYLDYSPMPNGMHGGSIEGMLKHPIGTYWHEIYPVFCNSYKLTSWDDNGDGELSFCDVIDITTVENPETTWWHVEEVTLDITVREIPMPICLGDCYSDQECNEDHLVKQNVPCFECLGPGSTGGIGESWKPTTRCPNRELDCPPDWCLTECPACCDGWDNDGDGAIDCPADDGCACCCDATEDGDSEPCVPELATIALVGVGILGIIGIGLRRRE